MTACKTAFKRALRAMQQLFKQKIVRAAWHDGKSPM
jgi:hypothetical protein